MEIELLYSSLQVLFPFAIPENTFTFNNVRFTKADENYQVEHVFIVVGHTIVDLATRIKSRILI